MTERWYETDSYTYVFDAEAVRTEPFDKGTKVVLDGTYFFPEEGGQSPDRGTIDGYPVTDVQIRDGEIVHFVSGTVSSGQKVHCKVDREFRFRNMQMHSAEHIFSGLVFRLYGFANVGFHLSENSATMDYNGVLCDADVERLETLANQVIIENHKIRAWYPSEEEIKNLAYRSKKELTGPIRLVEIEDIDLCACCVPHVRGTAEIGCMKILSRENYKGGVRLHYIAGFRAVEHYRASLKLIAEAGQRLSVKPDGIVSAIEKLLNDNKELNYRLVEADRASAAAKIKDSCTPEAPDRLLLFLPGDGSVLRFAMDTAEQYVKGVCAIFSGDEERGYRYLLECPGGNVTVIQKALKEELGAKGGGPAHSVSGRADAKEADIRKLFERFW